jgi:Spy/CpxP family protein refolding chaperone
MEIFKQNQLLKRSVAILVVLNIVLIAIVFLNPSRPEKNREGNDNERLILTLKKELSLSNDQCEKMRGIRNDFFQEESRIREAVRAERDSMNEVIFTDSVNVSNANSLAIKISNYMYEMESLRIRQAQELMTICTLEQRKKFNQLNREIKDYFKPIKNDQRAPR